MQPTHKQLTMWVSTHLAASLLSMPKAPVTPLTGGVMIRCCRQTRCWWLSHNLLCSSWKMEDLGHLHMNGGISTESSFVQLILICYSFVADGPHICPWYYNALVRMQRFPSKKGITFCSWENESSLTECFNCSCDYSWLLWEMWLIESHRNLTSQAYMYTPCSELSILHFYSIFC